jgi:hypothetical protein
VELSSANGKPRNVSRIAQLPLKCRPWRRPRPSAWQVECTVHTVEFNAVEQPETKKVEIEAIVQFMVTEEGLRWRDDEGAKGCSPTERPQLLTLRTTVHRNANAANQGWG